MTTLFVTNLHNIYNRLPNRSLQRRLELFQHLVDTGINLCVYTDETYYPILSKYSNISVIIYHPEMPDTSELKLPRHRSKSKDTREYINLMHCKTEFVLDAAERFPDAKNLAWIDFSIFHMFKSVSLMKRALINVARQNYKMLLIPGVWARNNYPLLNRVVWRFSGCFFIGDRKSVVDFCTQARHYQTEFFRGGVLAWEVNYWAWLERNKYAPVHWYYGNHNDTLFGGLRPPDPPSLT